jgi:energy-coupling factor transporter ATP-binding protein EcfA2
VQSAHIVVSSAIEKTPRVLQCNGLFDVPPMDRTELSWDVNLPIDERDWNIGLIVGPSGSGKTTVARQLFPAQMTAEFEWPKTKSVLDGFPVEMSIKDITALMSSVGFSSPPSWLRPFHVLSTGEQFRVMMARTLAESPELAVVDEFTSVVDRTVAQIGSAAIAKTVRRLKRKFIAVTCHADVTDWLQPDWIYRPDLNEFHWRELQRFPRIELDVFRVHHQAWQMFRQHHYLDTSLNKSAVCFVAFWGARPVAFSSWITRFGRDTKHTRREHRTVTLPDFQGVGIGNRVSEFCAGIYTAVGIRALSTTSHPGMIGYRHASPVWRTLSLPKLHSPDGNTKSTNRSMRVKRATTRLTAGFEYVGPKIDRALAEAFLAA